MNNSSNNNWLYENPLLKNKNQRYYYDFGTGKKVEREEIKEKRDALLGALSKPTNQKKDDFLESFNDPYGEEETRREKFADFRANADKRTWDDDFLTGLDDPYGEKETERREKFAEMRANVDKCDWNEDGTLYPRFEASSKAHEALHPHYVASGKGKVLDGISTALTAASFVPGLDTFTNIAQIPVDLLRGDYISAGLDLVGAIPFVGEIADGAKTVRTADRIIDGGKALVKAADVADDVADTAKVFDTAKVSESLKPILDEAEDPMTEMAKRAEDIALGSPLQIPGDSTKKISVKKNGYYQIKYEWDASDGYSYTSRWHTRTPASPMEQGDTFVGERRVKGVNHGKNIIKKEHAVLLENGTFVDWKIWDLAKKTPELARTQEQRELLRRGHIVPKRR